jgi:predicted MFS family arabinose efflux permease
VTLGSFAVSAALIGIFVLLESRSAQPLMPLRLFRSRARVGSYIVMLITGSAVFAMFFFLTQYIQEVKGFSPLRAGFAFLPVSAVIVVTAQIASRLVPRIGPRLLIATGTLLAAGGLLGLAQLSPTSSYAAGILPYISLIGFGMGMIFVPVTLGAVAGVDQNDSGIASAMLNVGQQVGGTIGLSALVTVFSTGLNNYLGDLKSRVAHGRLARTDPALAPHSMFVHGFTQGADLALYTGASMMALAMVCALLLISVPKRSLVDADPFPVAA